MTIRKSLAALELSIVSQVIFSPSLLVLPLIFPRIVSLIVFFFSFLSSSLSFYYILSHFLSRCLSFIFSHSLSLYHILSPSPPLQMKTAVVTVLVALAAIVCANEREERILAYYSTTSITHLTTTTITGLQTCLSVSSTSCTGRRKRALAAPL